MEECGCVMWIPAPVVTACGIVRGVGGIGSRDAGVDAPYHVSESRRT